MGTEDASRYKLLPEAFVSFGAVSYCIIRSFSSAATLFNDFTLYCDVSQILGETDCRALGFIIQ